jgi:hypothetical protein
MEFLRPKSILTASLAMVVLLCLPAAAQWRLYFQSSLLTGGNPHDVYVVGDYAYLGNWRAGLAVIDVSDPWQPELVFQYDTPGLSNSVFVSGSLALVADWNHGVTIFDISEPASPVYLSVFETPGVAYNVFVDSSYLFIADFNTGLVVVDISDPSNPVLETTVPTAGLATGIWGSGHFIYLADYPDGLLTYEISDPSAPQLVDALPSSGDAINVTGWGEYVFLSDGRAGVKILSIIDPADPALISAVNTPEYANDVAISDTVMYVSVIAFSIADPAFPYEIDRYHSLGIARGIFARGRNVFLGDNYDFVTLLLSDATGIDDDRGGKPPDSFELHGIYPNPFNPQAFIEFSLFRQQVISLDVYDLVGRHVEAVVRGRFEAGTYRVSWDGRDRPSGVYFFTLKGNGVSKTVKAALLK